MDAAEIIFHLRDQLAIEERPKAQAALRRRLIEEEERLGRHLNRLSEIEAAIARWRERIEKQATDVASLEGLGRDATVAASLLDSFFDTLEMYQRFRFSILMSDRPKGDAQGD